jgi:hypothetical protein
MGFIELAFDILSDTETEGFDEFGDLDQTVLMTFSKITHNYYQNYQKVRKVLKYMVEEFIQMYNKEIGKEEPPD